MTLRVVGAGLGRTGTASLKAALTELLGAPCYHMIDVFQRPADVPRWRAAARNDAVDWDAMFEGYAAAVDWPASAFWPELAAKYPDAIILLSTRDAERWWESANSTIFAKTDGPGPGGPEWGAMLDEIMAARFTPNRFDKASSIAAFEKHNANVRATAPKSRLVEWTASDGWDPICNALGLPIPSTPFPKTNTREEFIARRAAR